MVFSVNSLKFLGVRFLLLFDYYSTYIYINVCGMCVCVCVCMCVCV